MSSTYYQVPADRIVELRKIADGLRDTQELNALCMLYGLRSMQQCDEDMLKGGDVEPQHLLGKEDCEDRAASFLEDTICTAEMMAVARVNELGDYSIKVVPIVTLVKSI